MWTYTLTKWSWVWGWKWKPIAKLFNDTHFTDTTISTQSFIRVDFLCFEFILDLNGRCRRFGIGLLPEWARLNRD